MILTILILILLAGGLLAWATERISPSWPRYVSLAAVTIDLVLGLILWAKYGGQAALPPAQIWLVEAKVPWIPQFGISFHLGMDGLSLLMLLLTFVIGIVSVATSWTEIQQRVGFFHFNLMWILAGITGVFLALDLFLFYFFWEMMLIPMYFLIIIWGHENRVYAGIKFFLFTQASSLLMLLSIVALVFIHYENTGQLTFDYTPLLSVTLERNAATWLMLGFFVAFAVKLPVVPLHTWLPDAHTEAPTAGSVILAGLLLKTGAYGMLRFVLPLFPQASWAMAPIAMALGVVGILYGAILAFAQTDLKRLVAYTSVSHLGFVILGIFAWNEQALQGAVMQMICHGLSTGALFILVGQLYERVHTRDLRRMGGFWAVAPRMGAMAMFFAMASLGLPGLGNFVAEFLVLLGAYRVSIALTALAGVGLITATVYSLWLVQRAFHGPAEEGKAFPDLGTREMAIMGLLVVLLVWLGLYPQPVFETAKAVLVRLHDLGAMMGA